MIIRMGPGGRDAGPTEKPTPEQQQQIDRTVVRSSRQELSRLMLGWFGAAHPVAERALHVRGRGRVAGRQGVRDRREERGRLRGPALHRQGDAPAADGHVSGAAGARGDLGRSAWRRAARRRRAGPAAGPAAHRRGAEEGWPTTRSGRRRSCGTSRPRWWTTRSTSTTGATWTGSSSRTASGAPRRARRRKSGASARCGSTRRSIRRNSSGRRWNRSAGDARRKGAATT